MLDYVGPSAANYTLKMSKKDGSEPRRLPVSFLQSAPDLRRCPGESGPEVAFAGRSNAGKSSVLNRLTGNRRTAKVSKTPGRTQLLNFFDVSGGGRIVDLPGYGYAKATRSAQAAWQAAVNEYLSERESLVAVVLVMDIRHPLQSYDLELIEWSTPSDLPVRALLNKCDKLKSGARGKALAQVRRALSDHPNVSVQAFSAQNGYGQTELLEWLETRLTSH